MKKVRVFFAAAALILVTAGAFAAKEKFFAAPTNLYYLDNSSVYEPITTSGSFSSSFIVGGTPAQILGTNSAQYDLYTYTGVVGNPYSPVSTTF